MLWTLWTFGSLCWLLSCLNIVILFHRTPSGNNNNNALKLYKVPPRFELGSLDSKSRVLTITPLHHGTLLEHTLLKNGSYFVHKGSWTSIFCFILLTLWEFSRINPEFCHICGGALLFSVPTKFNPPPSLAAVEKSLKFKSNTVFLLGSWAFLLYSISL